MQYNESKEQASLIYWANLATAKYPDLKWLHCSLSAGKRNKIQSKIAKTQGMVKGVPDLFLPTKRGNYSGIYIEMKYGKNKATPEQLAFLEYANSQGFYTVICYSWITAKDELIKYLES